MRGFIENLPLLCIHLPEGVWPCHKCLRVTALHAAFRSPLINVFAPIVEQCLKRSHHPASMERNLHHKVTRIHNRYLPMRNNRNKCSLMPSSYHPTLKLPSNKFHRMHNNSSHKIKAPSPKHLALLVSFSFCVASVGAGMLVIDHKDSAVAAVDASCYLLSCSSVWGYRLYIMPVKLPSAASPKV